MKVKHSISAVKHEVNSLIDLLNNSISISHNTLHLQVDKRQPNHKYILWETFSGF